MPKNQPFNEYSLEYDSWFDTNKIVYESELKIIQEQMPKKGQGLEVGVGSGRFAAPLLIPFGLEPSVQMSRIARDRGITVVGGVAEKMPFKNCNFNFVLMVTTICFLDDVESAFKESFRTLKPKGCFIVGFIDKNSVVGRSYQQHKNESKFYKDAVFYSVDEVICFLRNAGFHKMTFKQTIFQDTQIIKSLEPIKNGYGEGSFVVVKAMK
ncbi:MAG: class I SAM-dependent methyltransferase [Candidatus Aminicenantes bacterium]|nr:class I SAM-dependent methyltransferase [Candidatus Aminicenantes bacterium]